MESIGDVLKGMQGRGALPPGPGGGVGSIGPADQECPYCGGRGYVRVADPDRQVRVTRRDAKTRADIVCSVPYEHNVICPCRTQPTIPSLQDCGLVGKAARMTLQGFDPSDLAGDVFGEIQRWAAALPGVVTGTERHLPGFVFAGNTGAGKTHLAAALLHEARSRGLRCRLVPEVDVLEEIRVSYDADERALTEQRILERLRTVPLLCLDDVGQSYVAGAGAAMEAATWSSSLLYRVLNDRVSRERVTILTTNLTPEKLMLYLGKATQSRLQGFRVVAFTGRDRR